LQAAVCPKQSLTISNRAKIAKGPERLMTPGPESEPPEIDGREFASSDFPKTWFERCAAASLTALSEASLRI
ncbi:MAG: hypothetical protein WCC41_21570, partial [Rhodomicrobium sp.]